MSVYLLPLRFRSILHRPMVASALPRMFSLPFLAPSSDMPRRASLGRLVNQSTMLLMICIGTLILGLALLILFHENANATKGYNLRKLESQRSILLLQQEVLNMQIAEAQALEHLQADPAIATMIPAAKLRYTQQDPVVAVVRE